tara:strand:- start:30626 stop:31534 length:909 start_codon:yes stop_codon:yes gene_type:complete
MNIDVQKAGIGLRAPHYDDVLNKKPDVGFLEVHIENYFPKGGKTARALRDAAAAYPLSFHGVSMSLGSAEKPNADHLKRVKELVQEFNPALVSEHLSWSSIGETYISDLLPVPYTLEALDLFCRNVDIVQNALNRKILIENPSSYLLYNLESMGEGQFMAELVRRTGCGILLDVNNIFVSAQNTGGNALAHLQSMPLQHVGEIHLAGHTIKNYDGPDYKASQLSAEQLTDIHSGRTIRIDTHSDLVCDEVWALYEEALKHTGCTPTLIEWDLDIPDLDVLVSEAKKATMVMERVAKGNFHAA